MYMISRVIDDLMFYIVAIVFFVVFYRVAKFAIRENQKVQQQYLSLPTLEEYLKAHPDCGRDRGRALCHSCGSSNIHVRWNYGAKSEATGPKTHLCRNCGCSLWRSSVDTNVDLGHCRKEAWGSWHGQDAALLARGDTTQERFRM
jgi:hypothetical protein